MHDYYPDVNANCEELNLFMESRARMFNKDNEEEWTECCATRKKKRKKTGGTAAHAIKEQLGINLFESHFSNDKEVLNISNGDWVSFESVVDSGAAQSVAPSKGFFERIPARESEGQRRGQTYTAAAGKPLNNEGEKTLNVFTYENVPSQVTYQLADINKPLTAVGDVCDKDRLVIFCKNGGFIQNKEGNLTKFDRTKWNLCFKDVAEHGK